jgi:hypothetical protein
LENGYIESFNGKFRDELYRPPSPEAVLMTSLMSPLMAEASVTPNNLTEQWGLVRFLMRFASI